MGHPASCNAGRYASLFALALLLAPLTLPVAAQESPYKLTVGRYALSATDTQAATVGADINLRYSSEAIGNTWFGTYGQAQTGDTDKLKQSRTGWDKSIDIGRATGMPIRFQPSVQAASGGFWGGSAALEAGDSWYVGVGLGRTNLRPYVNLNFDPNDSLTLSAGKRLGAHDSIGFLIVKDNRLNPDQRHTHLVMRKSLAEHQRLVFDVLHKKGLVDGELISRVGYSLNYDYHQFFVRLAFDPKVNFSTQDMRRVQMGMRF